MKKLSLKKLIVLFFMIISMMLPVCAEGENIPANGAIKPQTYEYPAKQPVSRKKLAIKFIKAMIGVGVSSILIYVSLSLYNRFIFGAPVRQKSIDTSEDNSYKIPNNMKDALDIFLKKTK